MYIEKYTLVFFALAFILSAKGEHACEEGWEFYVKGENCIVVNNTLLSWENAFSFCESIEARLVVIYSQDKQKFIEDLDDIIESNGYWVGLSRRDDGQFQWVDKLILSDSEYNNWGPGQPGNSTDEDEDCVYFKGENGTWIASQCSDLMSFFCEKTAIPPTMSLECTEDYIKAVIEPHTAELVSSFAYFSNQSCVADHNDSRIILQTRLNECGTNYKFPNAEEIRYYNHISYIDATYDGSIISRFGEIKITIECDYKRSHALSFGSYVPKYDEFDTEVDGFGTMRFGMVMFESPEKQAKSLISIYPIAVQLGDTVFVEVSVESETPDMELFIESCVASASNNPLNTSALRHQLIENGCPVERTVKYVSTESPFSKMFSFEAFMFIDRTSEIFMHCETIVCSATDPDSVCSLLCYDQEMPLQMKRRQSRSQQLLPNTERNIISLGPFHIIPTDEEESTAASGST